MGDGGLPPCWKRVPDAEYVGLDVEAMVVGNFEVYFAVAVGSFAVVIESFEVDLVVGYFAVVAATESAAAIDTFAAAIEEFAAAIETFAAFAASFEGFAAAVEDCPDAAGWATVLCLGSQQRVLPCCAGRRHRLFSAVRASQVRLVILSTPVRILSSCPIGVLPVFRLAFVFWGSLRVLWGCNVSGNGCLSDDESSCRLPKAETRATFALATLECRI